MVVKNDTSKSVTFPTIVTNLQRLYKKRLEIRGRNVFIKQSVFYIHHLYDFDAQRYKHMIRPWFDFSAFYLP